MRGPRSSRNGASFSSCSLPRPTRKLAEAWPSPPSGAEQDVEADQRHEQLAALDLEAVKLVDRKPHGALQRNACRAARSPPSGRRRPAGCWKKAAISWSCPAWAVNSSASTSTSRAGAEPTWSMTTSNWSSTSCSVTTTRSGRTATLSCGFSRGRHDQPVVGRLRGAGRGWRRRNRIGRWRQPAGARGGTGSAPRPGRRDRLGLRHDFRRQAGEGHPAGIAVALAPAAAAPGDEAPPPTSASSAASHGQEQAMPPSDQRDCGEASLGRSPAAARRRWSLPAASDGVTGCARRAGDGARPERRRR